MQKKRNDEGDIKKFVIQTAHDGCVVSSKVMPKFWILLMKWWKRLSQTLSYLFLNQKRNPWKEYLEISAFHTPKMVSFPRMAHIYIYIDIPIFQNIHHDFPTFYKFDPCFGIFFLGGVKMRPMFIDFFVWNPPIWVAHPCSSPPAFPRPSCRGTQILISSIYGMHCYENFARKLWKNNVGKGHLFERVTLAGTLEWRGTLWVPPQPGCPRVCPPWAHRSYATANKYSTHDGKQFVRNWYFVSFWN